MEGAVVGGDQILLIEQEAEGSGGQGCSEHR